jgi:hypothetical protein
MRPKTIVYFEWIIFGTLLLSGLQVYLSWDEVLPAARNSYLATQIGSFVVIGTLTLLVSRRRSKIAMWVCIALLVLDLLNIHLFAIGLHTRESLQLGLQPGPTFRVLAVLVGQGVAYSLLFTPSARRWVRREDEKVREAA